ncbi:zinc finger CCCH domain-containing protein 13 isoform X1 [Cajanus cajan]|uniref:zinc finger CCCH domain-containing protein 13 isoform X1 n=1 Tax=Cajanus cajan TaxID=3821 RepID=UPI00098DA259|nr:zinc finger CCCH domain-containing protein 13 isoform X1 [Cajanus cajan]XP_020238912.1 zinc finger CCCH domain-containing protein 13 isoform X1 [Cajanus cajan]
MSGAPKRSHEESVHSSSKHPHEDSGTYSKLVSSSVSNEYHMPYDISQDARVAKAPRTEFRDADRRSPLHPVYRMSSSMNDSHADHPIGSENRIESRDSKDSRDLRFETRDTKTEKKELYGEARRDPPSAKSEKDVRVEGRGDDNKDVRHDRDSHNDSKGDNKTEKDGYNVVSSHLNWKDSKEYHRGKRYSDAPSGSLDTWHMLRANTQGSVEVGKESSTAEVRDYVEAHEAVGENKVDPKGDDRSKEKDRKRKDVKHRDWGDRERERSDRRNSTQVNNSSGDCKEFAKEDRDVERLEREKKDLPKEKENLKEREKDLMKRESWNAMEKEVSNNEKEPVDGSAKLPEQDVVLPEQKKQKDVDSWKNADREARERRKERDADLEGDRSDKHGRSFDKESNDGCVDGEGATEKEREAHNYSSQHRKRIQRSRGSPQVPNREPRFKSRAQDNERSQGKAEVSSVIYKVGESMQELIKLWEEYESSQMDKNVESSSNGPTLEIRIPSEHVTATNRQDALRHQYPYSANYLVRGGQLWGTDVYTYDSDLVAVLMHTGYCRPTASPPPAAIQELRATVRVLPPQDCYISTLRNNVRSRAWGAAIGCSYRVERCCIVKKGGGTIDLEPCLTHTSTIEPTLAPVTVERTMTTRAAASNALRQQKFVREVTIQYNLCNEPWIKYSISIVADKGLKKPLYTSARLKKGEVLYLETHLSRYELCFTGEKMIKATPATQLSDPATEKSQNHHPHSANGEKNDCENVMIDAFRWSRCKKPLPQKVMRTVGIPLPLEHIEVLEENLDWEDVQWSQTGVWIAGKEYTLARVHFVSMN